MKAISIFFYIIINFCNSTILLDNDPKFLIGEIQNLNFTYLDSLLGETIRQFIIYIPSSYRKSQNQPYPLLMFLHGQYGRANDSSNYTNFPAIGERENFISVFPQGKDDGNAGTGWNTGMMGNGSKTCDNTTQSYCYESCKRIGVCQRDGEPFAKCQWATCYNDVEFLSQLIRYLEENLSIDANSIFLTGESNGGMMTHWLSANMPNTFRAIAPVYATPLSGYLKVSQLSKNMRILALHDRNDSIIPWQGGNAQGWLYESEDSVMLKWGSLFDCDIEAGMLPLNTPFDKGDKNLVCKSYRGCSVDNFKKENYSSHRVIYCLYDGNHGDSFDNMYEMIWWFFKFDQTIKVEE